MTASAAPPATAASRRGARGPQLAGGKSLEDFRRVHEHGLFPPSVVTDKDFAAIVAFLKTKPRRGGSD